MPRRFHPQRFFRFSLGSLLLVILFVCGYFGGYRAGQLAAARDRYNELPSVRVYDLSDLTADLPTTADRQRLYRELTAYLKAAVPPDSWNAAGDVACDIHPFPATDSLAVLQRGAVHEQIEAALRRFRHLHEERLNSP